MSARYLKKVLKEQEFHQQQQQLHKSEDDDDDGDEEQLKDESGSPDLGLRSSRNPFDLLSDDEHDDEPDDGVQLQENESGAVDGTSIQNVDKKDPVAQKINVEVVSTSNHISKKKKNKKRSKEGSVSSTNKDKKALDEIVETLSLDANSSNCKPDLAKGEAAKRRESSNLVKQSASSILQIDPKYLNPENELRRIFGSKVVKSFENSHQTSSSRQIRGSRRGSHLSRKTMLVTPLDHWDRWDGSLTMEFLETKNGYHYFRYVHSSSYAQAQRAFEVAKAIHDLNGVASVLAYHHYHLDSLITLAEYFKVTGEHQQAADFIAKCLYAMECAWNPMFTPLQGNCQLKFSHETNKPLFTTLFTHMKNMDRRGCHRSALEVCKLLLSLDSDDPMGAMFCIDYFALRAEEYSWLERFSEDYRNDNSLWLFPNFSYSLAICRFYLEREPEKDAQSDATKASSTDLMMQALMLHPSVLKKLVAKAPLKDQSWTNILKHAFFRSDQSGSLSLDHLINIYVERSYIVWRLPDLQKLLRDSALLVIERLKHNESDAKDWACVRTEAFSSEKNEYGYLLVSDFSDSMPSIPPENLQNFMVDPRIGEIAQNGDQIANPNGGARAPRDVANRSALAVLFESMLPWVDYGGRDDGNPHNEYDQGNEDH